VLFYVDRFSEVVERSILHSNKPKILFPSTTFIDDGRGEFFEYPIAKTEAENLCEFFSNRPDASFFAHACLN
jgi:hypothetical protein